QMIPSPQAAWRTSHQATVLDQECLAKVLEFAYKAQASRETIGHAYNQIFRWRRIRRLHGSARERLRSGHRRIAGNLRRQRIYARCLRLVCVARLRGDLPRSVLAPRTRHSVNRQIGSGMAESLLTLSGTRRGESG